MASSKRAKENKGRLARGAAGRQGGCTGRAGLGSPGLGEPQEPGGLEGALASIGMGSPGLGDTGGLQGRRGHWKSWVWGSGWKQQDCFVGGTGAASVEANRARMPSAATLLTAISH